MRLGVVPKKVAWSGAIKWETRLAIISAGRASDRAPLRAAATLGNSRNAAASRSVNKQKASGPASRTCRR
jgi:hypothetical protein